MGRGLILQPELAKEIFYCNKIIFEEDNGDNKFSPSKSCIKCPIEEMKFLGKYEMLLSTEYNYAPSVPLPYLYFQWIVSNYNLRLKKLYIKNWPRKMVKPKSILFQPFQYSSAARLLEYYAPIPSHGCNQLFVLKYCHHLMPSCAFNYGFVYCQDAPDRCFYTRANQLGGVRYFHLFFHFVGKYELNLVLKVLNLFEEVTNFNNELFLTPLCIREKYFRFFVHTKHTVQNVLIK